MRFTELARDFGHSALRLASFGRFGRKSLTIIRDNFVQVGSVPQVLTSRISTEGLNSNVVMAPVFWIMRTFTEATAVVQKVNDKDVWKKVRDHELQILLEQPNAFYDGDALWKATCISYVLAGNAYWRKIRNAFGDVIALWYIPHWMIHPRWPMDGTKFISHYDYTSGIAPVEPVAVRDVVHFRFGLDPENTRLGFPPLRPLLREVMSDDDAARFTVKILQNMGFPGLIVSPKNENYRPSEQAVKELREYMKVAFANEHRGDPLVLGVPTEVAQFGFDSNKIMLPNLRDISEERVCASLGLPAAIVGFGAGLQSTKVGATMRELRKLAWVQCLTPMQNTLACQLTAQLMPDFVAQTRRFRVQFDTSGVAAFLEDDDLRAARVARLVIAGILRVDRAQDALDLEVDDNMKVYLQPTTSKAIDENGDPVTAAIPTPVTPPPTPDPNAPPDPNADPNAKSADDEMTRMLKAIESRLITANGNH
jgi:HK97 family phage portal protein